MNVEITPIYALLDGLSNIAVHKPFRSFSAPFSLLIFSAADDQTRLEAFPKNSVQEMILFGSHQLHKFLARSYKWSLVLCPIAFPKAPV